MERTAERSLVIHYIVKYNDIVKYNECYFFLQFGSVVKVRGRSRARTFAGAQRHCRVWLWSAVSIETELIQWLD